MDWFKHDSTANLDDKLQEVLLDYGLEGYGLYWYCIELIVSRVSPENITFELSTMLVSLLATQGLLHRR